MCRIATHQGGSSAGCRPPCQHEALRVTRVRTAELQPVMVQRSLLRTLMEDARRGSIRIARSLEWCLPCLALERLGVLALRQHCPSHTSVLCGDGHDRLPVAASLLEAITRNNSAQPSVRMPTSPLCRWTIRPKVFHGTNSITCANSVLPTFMRHHGSFYPASIANRRFEIQIVDTHETQETSVSIGLAAC